MVCPRRSYSLEARICIRGEDPGFHENVVDWDVDGALHKGRDCCFGEARGGRSYAALAILIEGSRFFFNLGFDYRFYTKKTNRSKKHDDNEGKCECT